MSHLQRAALSLITLAFIASFAAAPAHSEGLVKGNTLLSIEATTGVADLATPERGTGIITAYDHSEWGGQLQFQHMLSDKWAFAVSGGIGTFKETDKAGTNAPPNTPDFVYKQSSWNVRLGADRFVSLGERFDFFVGPGLQYWSGKAKFTSSPAEVESQSTNRFAFNGRIGARVGLSDKVALVGHIGYYLGTASAKDTGAEVHWSPSGTESAVGFAFSL